MCARFRVAAGRSTTLGMASFLSGTHRKDFRKECPSCFDGGFCREEQESNSINWVSNNDKPSGITRNRASS